MNMKHFCGELSFWYAYIPHICNLLCNIVLEKYKKLIETSRGFPEIIFIVFPPPQKKKNWARKIYTKYLTNSEAT